MTALGKPAAASADRKSFIAFAGDETTRTAVAEAAAKRGYADVAVEPGTVADAAKHLSGMPTPPRVVVDITGVNDPLKALDALAHVCDEGTRVIVLGAVNDVDLYRGLLAAGTDDYLVKPVVADDLAAVLLRLDETTRSEEPGSGHGRIVAVVGARGGVGATTTAVNLAWLFAHEHGLRTALVDLDLHFGTCAMAFDMAPSSGLREVLANAERIDELFVERAMLPVSDTLSVLAPKEEIVESQPFNFSALQLLVETLRGLFPMVVMDLPRFAARTQIGVLEPPLSIALVTDPSLSGMRDTLKLRAWFEKLAPAADTFVALNRVGAAPNAELSREDFETNAGLKAACAIPLDVKAAAGAAVEAKPLVRTAPRRSAAKALVALAERVAGPPAQTERATGLRRLLKARG